MWFMEELRAAGPPSEAARRAASARASVSSAAYVNSNDAPTTCGTEVCVRDSGESSRLLCNDTSDGWPSYTRYWVRWPCQGVKHHISRQRCSPVSPALGIEAWPGWG